MYIDIDIDDILCSCSRREKRELYEALIEDGTCLSDKEQQQKKCEERQRENFLLMETLQAMDNYTLKRTLCDLLGVPTLHDPDALRQALEPIVTAI